ncbi:MAG: hypothetical protein RLZZ126_216 [Pseudomonadota bacterium]|jgi:uncharacterized protein YcfJ
MRPTFFTLAPASLAAGVLLASGPAMAQQETARVISSTPVMTQVAVPRQVCSTQQVTSQAPKSGLGGIMGAVAGGAIGSNIGGGDGRIAATMLGVIGGAMLGDRMEGPGSSQTQNVQSCSTQTFYETRTTAYNVVYEYGGKQYTVQMPQDPGPTLRLQITPMPAADATPAQQVPAVIQQPAVSGQVVQPQVFVAQAPVPVAVAAPVYVQPPLVRYVRPPVTVGVQLIGSGYHGRPYHAHGYGYGRLIW